METPRTEEERDYKGTEVFRQFKKNACLMHDHFMRICFDDSKSTVQLVLRKILSKPDLEVTEMTVQKDIPNIHGRSLVLDILARSEGVLYNCEVQNASGDSSPQRARFHGSLLDVHSLGKGEQFRSLPETYVIFITSNDKYGKGLSLYSFDRYCPEIDSNLEDGSHIIYVNGEYRGDDDIGYLMHDFKCTNPDEMHYTELAERVAYIKNTKAGEKKMSDIFELVKEEGRAEGREEGRVEGREEGRAEGEDKLAKLISKLIDQGRNGEIAKVTSDVEFRNSLYKELGIA